MNVDVLFVGAGHAHLHALSQTRRLVARGARVTLVAPGDFWYSGMGPGVLSGMYSPEQDRVDVARLVESAGGRFVRDRVVRIDADRNGVELSSGARVDYDVMSLNVGSEIPLERVAGAAARGVPVKPVEHYARLAERWRERATSGAPLRAVVVGSGAAGCETVANAWRLARDIGLEASLTLVGSSASLLAGFTVRAANLASEWLERHGVEVIGGARVTRVDASGITLGDGRAIEADEVIFATGVRPPRLLGDSSLETDNRGALVVDRTLRSVSHPNVLGGGDCIRFAPRELDRVGVYAVRQGRILLSNLSTLCSRDVRRRPLKRFRPQRRYLLILNLGGETGLLAWGPLALRGRLALRFKDRLDRGFIERYQSLARRA
jgi:NADH dehydrogenase FAD-containing subunit